jgi:hypothetical protein
MLKQLSDDINECYLRASQARERGECERDPQLKQDHLDMERRWLFLAQSYELTVRMQHYTDDVKRRSARKQHQGLTAIAGP